MSEFLISFFVVALIILGNIGIGYAIYSQSQNKKSPWKKFATSNNLEFVPGRFLRRGTHVIGEHRGHFIELDTFEKTRSTSYTHLIIFINHSPDNQFLSDGRSAIKKLTHLFAAVNTHFPLKGRINGKRDELAVYANLNGPTVYYEQQGVENDVENLQLILDRLSDLADYYPVVMILGGRVVPFLQSVATAKKHRLRRLATRWLEDIAEETKKRLGNRPSQFLCPYCLVQCGTHSINNSGRGSTVYYGCQRCGQSQQFIDLDKCQVVAELNNQSTVGQYQYNSVLRVNWLIQRKLFYFDKIEIIRATDEEVERFAVQIGNDTEGTNQSRYKLLNCEISKSCELSENTIRILQRMFGQVEMKEFVNSQSSNAKQRAT